MHALQIEVNRGLYIDELTLEKRPDFNVLAAGLFTFMRQLAEFAEEYSGTTALAAE